MRINLDGTILSALSRIFDVLVATVLFILCCLPVFTVGAASAAMYATMIAIAGDGCSSVFRRFFGAFRENFKQATMLWLVIFLIGLVVGADIVICWGFKMNPNIALALMRGLTVFCSSLYCVVSVYIFAGIAVYQVTWKQAISNALLWTVKKIPETLGILALCALMAFSVLVLWYYAVAVFAPCLYFQGKLLRRVFGLQPDKREHMEEQIHYGGRGERT